MMVIMVINGNRGHIGHHGNIREVVQKRGPFSRPFLSEELSNYSSLGGF